MTQLEKQQHKIVTHYDHLLQSNAQRIQRLNKNKAALENVINRLRYQSAKGVNGQKFVKTKGHLLWPTQGKISEPYGHAMAGNIKSNSVIIAAHSGQNVYAIASGKVVFSNWLRGFGLLIIIDHGNGYMSLYGYNRSLYKKTGDTVKAGDLIASVGQSGGQSKPGLYFALRHNNQPLNPSKWCKKA